MEKAYRYECILAIKTDTNYNIRENIIRSLTNTFNITNAWQTNKVQLAYDIKGFNEAIFYILQINQKFPIPKLEFDKVTNPYNLYLLRSAIFKANEFVDYGKDASPINLKELNKAHEKV